MDRRHFLKSSSAAAVATGLTPHGQLPSRGAVSLSDARVIAGRDAQIRAFADALQPQLVTTRRDFHMNPELTWQESRTARVVVERLRAMGITAIETGVARFGVVATVTGGKRGPTVGVRADMDALPINETLDVPYRSRTPGVKHACGHDVHTTVALGVAELLHRMRAELPGTVRFFFQPAEEGGRGAQAMVDAGVLAVQQPRALFALHVSNMHEVGTFGYTSGIAMAAADRFTLHVKGRMAHGALPENSIDSILVASHCVTALQSIRSRRISTNEPMVLSFGSVHGGNMFNVIPGEVAYEGTIRTLSDRVRDEVRAMITQTVAGQAAAFGATAELEFHEIATVTFNEPALAEESVPTLRRIAGASGVVQGKAVMAAEDFSYMQKVVPGFYFNLGTKNTAKGIGHFPVHTPDFDVDEASLAIGVRGMASVVWDYLERHAAD